MKKLILLLCLVIFLISFASAAKGYSFTDVPQPTSPSATAVDGGSLNANTTYYYRIYKVATSASGNSWSGKSLPSDEFNFTTTDDNKTANITFTCADTSGSYRIFRSTTSGGMLGTYVPSIAFYPSDALYNSGGTVTFNDTGYAGGGNNYMEIVDNAHGVLTLSGSNSTDKFSIVDLYNADVASEWGVIQRLDVNTYKVNTYLIGHTDLYWADVSKTIIFSDGASFGTNQNFQFGEISGNKTLKGCNIIVTSTWLSYLSFGNLNAYQTRFQYIFPNTTAEDAQLGFVGGSFYTGILQDCTIDKFRNFVPLIGANCTFRNVVMSRFDNAFNNGAANYDGIKMLSGSGIWQIVGGNISVVGRDVYSEGTAAVLVAGSDSTSSLSTIDSTISQSIIVNSDSTGFRWYDKISFNLKILDTNGSAINGANLEIYDKDDTLIVNTTSDSNGTVVEQNITKRFFEVNGTSVLPENNSSPFTIIISKTGYETYQTTFNITDKIDWTIALEGQPAWNYSWIPDFKILNQTKHTIFKITDDGNLAIAGNLFENTNSPPPGVNIIWSLFDFAWLDDMGNLYLNKLYELILPYWKAIKD